MFYHMKTRNEFRDWSSIYFIISFRLKYNVSIKFAVYISNE